jgi:hypothetical protein
MIYDLTTDPFQIYISFKIPTSSFHVHQIFFQNFIKTMYFLFETV